MFLKYFVIAVPILMVAFFNPLISFLSIYTYCTSEMLPINQASKNDDLTREGVQKALMGDEIQDETCTDKNKGINGLTGNITLHGSDRCNPSSELVRPIYLKDTKQWQWQKLPKPYK
jgi:hypothetical protein